MATLYRPRRGRVLAGVCAAIALRLGWNPWIVRLLWVILSFIPGPLWVAYIALWLIIPSD